MAATTYLSSMNKKSIEIADSLGGLKKDDDEPFHNDQYDAFRHAYTSARISETFGVNFAKWLGDRNESKNTSPTDPKERLQYNAEKIWIYGTIMLAEWSMKTGKMHMT